METQQLIEVTVKADNARTYYISHPDFHYGIFCFNDSGDLFLNSDWGMMGFAWRAYGKDFKEFLKGTNPEYIYGKFDTNSRYLYSKGLPKHTEKPVTQLIKAFIDHLKSES